MGRYEDSRIEVDVLLETTQSALSHLELLWKELEELEQTVNTPLGLQPNALSAVQEEAIRRIYASNGTDSEIMHVGEKEWDEEMMNSSSALILAVVFLALWNDFVRNFLSGKKSEID